MRSLVFARSSIYLVAQAELNTVDQRLVPRGDAFTYSIFLYEILNRVHESFGSTFRHVVESGNFIWLQHLLVLVFSPFLYNQRGSLIFINYFGFFISSVVVLRTALLCGVSRLLGVRHHASIRGDAVEFPSTHDFQPRLLDARTYFRGAPPCAP